jgi:hypothetical protein
MAQKVAMFAYHVPMSQAPYGIGRRKERQSLPESERISTRLFNSAYENARMVAKRFPCIVFVPSLSW